MCWRNIMVVAWVLVAFMSSSLWSASVGVSRFSSLAASGQTSQDQFDLSASFDNFGTYSDSIGDELSTGSGGVTRAQASQQSLAMAIPVSGSAVGIADAQVAELDAIAAQARSTFRYTFDVLAQPETLTLSGEVAATFDGSARVAVLDEATQVLFERIVNLGEQDTLGMNESIVLSPGRYQLLAEAVVTGTPSPNSGSFELTYRVTNPIPLPAGSWAGCVGAIFALLLATRKRFS